MTRGDGRLYDELRPTRITADTLMFAEGSATIETGHTQVLCAVSVEDGVPPFLQDSGQGWITAEYAMLPRHANADSPGGSQRAQGQDAGDPATHRTFASCRGRSRQARRANDHRRLRRHSGGRRHAHRLDHGSLRGPLPGALRPRGRRSTARTPAEMRRRVHQRRHSRMARRCSISTTRKTRRPRSTSTS